jgi:methyl-accepting chemotaxis protein
MRPSDRSRKLKLGAKLIASIIAIDVLVIVALVGFIYSRSSALQVAAAMEGAANLAASHAAAVEAELEVPMDAARTIAQIMERYRDLDAAERRKDYDIVLKGIVESNPGFLGTWTCWEPNALDGLDARYANAKGSDATGRYIPYWNRGSGSVSVEPLIDYDKAGAGDYYQIALKSGEETIVDPYVYKVGGKDVMMTSVVVPIKEGGKVIGVAGIDIELSKLQTLVDGIKPYGTGVAAIFSNGGIVAAHFDKARLGKQMRESERDMAGDKTEAFADAVKAGKDFSYATFSAQMKTTIQVISVPFDIGSAKTPWSLAVGIPMDKVLAPVRGMLWFAIAFGLAAIALVSIAVFLIARSIVRPLRLVVQATGSLATGDLAMSGIDVEGTRKVIARGDELGDVGRSLDGLIRSLGDVIGQIGIASNQVSNGSGQLSQTAQGISQGASEQAASIEELSASVEELAATVRQNADNTSQANALAKRVTQNADESGKSVRKMVESMGQIAARISIIEEIARNTNLLALNAAIEAARAGEFGKGFAVVASEVRKLAERSQTAAGEINELSRSSVEIAADAGKRLDALLPDIRRTAELIQEIAAASAEQSSGADQIAKGVGQMDSVVQQNASASEELASTAEELEGQARHLGETIGFFKMAEGGTAAAKAAYKAVKKEQPKTEARPSRAIVPAKVARGDASDEDFQEF